MNNNDLDFCFLMGMLFGGSVGFLIFMLVDIIMNPLLSSIWKLMFLAPMTIFFLIFSLWEFMQVRNSKQESKRVYLNKTKEVKK